jgi:hypothetical protein
MSGFAQFGLLNAAILAAFGQPVAYQPASGDPFTPMGILEKATDEQRHADGVYARLFLNLADCTVEPDHGDQVTVNGVVYTVFEVLIDASGGVRLSLRAQ